MCGRAAFLDEEHQLGEVVVVGHDVVEESAVVAARVGQGRVVQPRLAAHRGEFVHQSLQARPFLHRPFAVHVDPHSGWRDGEHGLHESRRRVAVLRDCWGGREGSRRGSVRDGTPGGSRCTHIEVFFGWYTG